jgi:hypothetical protein
MEGCEFSLGNDDCLNIHDSTRFGIKNGPKSLRIPSVRASFLKGDPVEFRNEDFSPANFKTKFVSERREKPGSQALIMEFEDELPGELGARYVIFNWRYDSSNVIVRDSYFHDNRARGLLLLARNVTVEGCRFLRNQMGAIKIETGYTLNSWCEGYGASNIVVRNNLFDSVNPRAAYGNERTPAIYISSYLRSDPSTLKTSYPILRDILIEGNRFVECPGAIVYACSAENVIVRGNSIVNERPMLSALPYRGSIATAYSSGVYATDNVWTESKLMPKPGLYVDSETSKNVFCWGNKVQSQAK